YNDDLFANTSDDMFGDYWEFDSSESSSSKPQDHFVLTKHILLYIMMTIGVPANFLILYVSFKNRKKLPSSSWLVINLALSDFLLLLSVPLEVSRSTYDGGVQQLSNIFLCKYYLTVKQLFFILSILIIATIAFDRYRMISSMSKSSAHKYTAYAVGVWTTSLLLCSPILYFTTVQADYNQDSGEVDYTQCKVSWIFQSEAECKEIYNKSDLELGDCPEMKSIGSCGEPLLEMERMYTIFIYAVTIIFPIVGTIILYTGLLHKVSFIRQSITSIGRSSKGNSKSQGRGGKGDQTLRRSIKLFTSVLVISWLPVVIWKIIRLCGFELDDKFCYGYSKFAETSLWIGPALNPILYSFLGRRFRKDLLATFPCIKQEQNPIISEYTQQSRATVNTTNELSLQMINDEEKQLLPSSENKTLPFSEKD
ncbi:unnamed protein product, partial [Oikopleura dioica]